MITDHSEIDLSHQGVRQDDSYPLKGQMPRMIPLPEENNPEAGPTKTDIVIRLRDWETIYPEDINHEDITEDLGSLYLAAAEEIEQLRKELDACAGNLVIEDD